MNAQQYTILAYVIVGVLLWGYAAHLLVTARTLKHRETPTGGK